MRGSRTFRFHIPQYLSRRAKDWADRGFKETLVDWPSLNARSKFWGDDQRAAFKNWEEIDEPLRAAQGHCREHPAPRVPATRHDEGHAGQQARSARSRFTRRCRPARSGWRRSPVINSRIISYPFGPERRHHRNSDPGGLRAGSHTTRCSSSPPMATAGSSIAVVTGTTPTRSAGARSSRSRSIFWSSQEWSTWR